MSDSVRPHIWQPTRLPNPWNSLSKNTGVGCHFLLQCMKVKSESEIVQLCPTLSDPMDCSPPGSSIQGIFQARVLEWRAIAFSRINSERGQSFLLFRYKVYGLRSCIITDAYLIWGSGKTVNKFNNSKIKEIRKQMNLTKSKE